MTQLVIHGNLVTVNETRLLFRNCYLIAPCVSFRGGQTNQTKKEIETFKTRLWVSTSEKGGPSLILFGHISVLLSSCWRRESKEETNRDAEPRSPGP
jgi:hypothetical protein